MKHFSAIFCSLAILLSLGFSRDVELVKKGQNSIIFNSQEFDFRSTPILPSLNESREQIDLYLEDFEGDHGWTGDGWGTTNENSYSPSQSQNSVDDATTSGQAWDLLSPVISLPSLGEGETMHFDFFLDNKMPDFSQDDDPSTPDDESGYLADYYAISLLDLAALAWHPSDYNSFDGPNWFCGFEDIGNGNPGYLDAWVQYLDTPSFTVPSDGTLSADMYWAIESPAGATVAGTCTDGWDQANVQISVDGGETFMMLESAAYPYDFGCGYGMVYNGFNCTGSDCPGWGGMSNGWQNVDFDLSAYAGSEAIVRFAFYADPGFSTLDDPTISGFQVDNILVSSGAFSDTADDEDNMSVSGAVWTEQFYDYFDDTAGAERPGSLGWEQYLPGSAFNGNVFMDISEFAGKDVVFRVQTRYDDDLSLTGDGLFIDDFRVYKESGGSYPSPAGLMAESGDSEIMLSWVDMNGSGDNVDFIFDNDTFDNSIQMSTAGSTAWAGERIDLVGNSTVNTISIFNSSEENVETKIAVFGLLGSLFNNSPAYEQTVTLPVLGWNTFDVNLNMSNGYIVAHEFTNVDSTAGGMYAALDQTVQAPTKSMVLFSGGAWEPWSEGGAAIGDGEWGVRANISYEGAGVTYNVYRDGDPAPVASALGDAMYTDTGLVNNQEYYYQVTATYGDGTESDYSEVVFATPFANTVYEASYDDGSADAFWNAGSGKTTVVKFTACPDGEQLVRFKWYQEEDAGAFYIKMHADNAGTPGEELFSQVVAGGLVSGWNEYDLFDEALSVSGDFWLGIREFSSTRGIGVDTSSDAGFSQENSSGDFLPVAGNVMIRALLDEVNCGTVQCGTGDVNIDGNVDVLDVVQVVNFIIGNSAPDDVQGCAADMNEDGNIDVLDVVQMVNMIINI